MRASPAMTTWLGTYYGHLDAMNIDGCMSMFAPDARLVFANQKPCEGKDAIRAALTEVLGSIAGIRHVRHTVWEEDGGLAIFECDVHFTR